uniref:Uncharacterized protein n=1 Tax=Arundo donax TaxID=35708 RepID=A0A0A9CEJ6_ARUDO
MARRHRDDKLKPASSGWCGPI